jgi:pimeloyl-ACP methyl ester carboxylesterase
MPSRQRKLIRLNKTLLKLLLPLLMLLVVIWFLVSFYVVHQLMHPESMAEVIDPSAYLLPFQELSWNGKDAAELKAWFIKAKPASPVIFLCHGYGSNRSHVLSLAERLYANGFSCVVLAFRGHGQLSGIPSSLGWLEATDLKAARNELRRLNWISSEKLGAWGTDMGAFVALSVASRDAGFRAVAIDCGFDSVGRYLDYRAARIAGVVYPAIGFLVRRVFALRAAGNWLQEAPAVQADTLGGVATMALISDREPACSELFGDLQQQMRSGSVIHLARTRRDGLNGPDLKEYDNRVAGFFRSVNWQ